MLCIVAFSLMVVLAIAAVVSAITTTLFPDRDTSLGWGGTSIIAIAAISFSVAWWRSRRPREAVGAWLTIVTIDAFLLSLAPSFPDLSATLAIGFAVPVLCATLFLDIRGTIVVFAMSAVLGTVHLLVASPSVAEGAFIIAIMVVVTVLTVIVASIREDDLRNVKLLRDFEQRDADRLKGELELARKVQRAMLPDVLPVVRGLDLAAYSESAFEASGDFYDVFELGDADVDREIGVVVCDVAGKGVASALVMSATRAALRAEAQSASSPAVVLAKVNNTLAASVPAGLFVTIFYGIYEPSSRRLRYSSAGHPHPLRGSLHRDGVEELESYGLPLGLVAGTEYEDRAADLAVGDYVLVYTDGLVEALDEHRDMYGFDAVREHLAAEGRRPMPAQEILDSSLEGMRTFIGTERLHDDVTVVAFCVSDELTSAESLEAGGALEGARREVAWTAER